MSLDDFLLFDFKSYQNKKYSEKLKTFDTNQGNIVFDIDESQRVKELNRVKSDEFYKLMNRYDNIKEVYFKETLDKLNDKVFDQSIFFNPDKVNRVTVLIDEENEKELVKRYANFFQIFYKQFLLFNYADLETMNKKIEEANINKILKKADTINIFFSKYNKIIKKSCSYLNYYKITNNSKYYYLFLFQLFNQFHLPTIYLISQTDLFDYTEVRERNMYYFDKKINFRIKNYKSIGRSIEYGFSPFDSEKQKYNAVDDFDSNPKYQGLNYFSYYISEIVNFSTSPTLNMELLTSYIDSEQLKCATYDLMGQLMGLSADLSCMILENKEDRIVIRNIIELIKKLKKGTIYEKIVEELLTSSNQKEDYFTNYKNLIFYVYWQLNKYK